MIGIVVLLVAPAVFGAVQVYRRKVRLLVAVVGWLGVSATMLVVLLGQLTVIDHSVLPPDDGLRGRLPAGLAVTHQQEEWAAGSYWREYTIKDVGGASGDTVEQRLLAAGLDGCRRSVWWPDLRRRCIHVSEVRGGQVMVGDMLVR